MTYPTCEIVAQLFQTILFEHEPSSVIPAELRLLYTPHRFLSGSTCFVNLIRMMRFVDGPKLQHSPDTLFNINVGPVELNPSPQPPMLPCILAHSSYRVLEFILWDNVDGDYFVDSKTFWRAIANSAVTQLLVSKRGRGGLTERREKSRFTLFRRIRCELIIFSCLG